MWNILSMRPSCSGQGQASCMLQLPGIINHSCFWLLPCSQTGPPSLFEREAGPPYDKQRIQMGLRSGNTVLICFRSGVGHFQSVLIALAADLHTNKPWQGQHKFWKYVSPIRTYFAWLPEQLARTYCSAALDRRSDLPYGEVHHLQGSEYDFRHSMVFQNIYHIGDTKSAQELGAGAVHWDVSCQCTGSHSTTSTFHGTYGERPQKLFTAALKLLWFAIGIETVRCENEAQIALHAALLPLLRLEDGHVLATLSAIVLALCEGRTGLAISGVFGAGKTRSAAALLAGLLVFDPSLQLMVLTKENIAAHAVAEHLVSLQMPDYLQEKMGRLVGYYEQNRKGSYTPLDILPSNRNQVIRQKSLLIGCGGGFQQECSQQFSPVADWMGSVDLFLEDEGQQYGNMEEAASVARTPATCLGTLMYGAGHVWAGHAHFYLHDQELSRSPPDETFIDMLKQNCCLSGPHLEALQDYVTHYHKVRRLHLIVVDLWRPWKYNTALFFFAGAVRA